jgi:RNA polymerase sigma-70 factor (ECF subfamily)
MKSVVRYIRKVATQQVSEGLTDGQLLEAFLTARDEAAFEALLRRHGPMVLGVCRRVLNNPQDSEDAFQATFLVLVRKAGSIQRRALLGNWLYGVACRTARRARAMNIQRQKKERAAPHGNGACPESQETSPEELLRHLDTELSRLPDKYRMPVVLCELEGKSRKEAARLLGLAEGTLSWRLAWARKLLARRMARHGVALSVAGLAASFSSTASGAVPLTLFSSTAKVAMQVAAGRALMAVVTSAQVITLTEGVLKAMLLSKLKLIWTMALVVAVGAGVAGLTYRAVGAQPGGPGEPLAQARETPDDLEALRLELEALRRGLQATRERVKSLESEMQTLKQASAAQPQTPMADNAKAVERMTRLPLTGGGAMFGQGSQPGAGGQDFFPSRGSGGGFRPDDNSQGLKPGASGKSIRPGSGPSKVTGWGARRAEDPLVEAETALKELRQHPGSKPAMARLDRALLQMKEQAGPDAAGGKNEPKP